MIVVVGDAKSSNTTKLFEISKKHNVNSTTIMVDNVEEIKKLDLSKFKSAVLTSGTSAPLVIIKQIEDYLRTL